MMIEPISDIRRYALYIEARVLNLATGNIEERIFETDGLPGNREVVRVKKLVVP